MCLKWLKGGRRRHSRRSWRDIDRKDRPRSRSRSRERRRGRSRSRSRDRDRDRPRYGEARNERDIAKPAPRPATAAAAAGAARAGGAADGGKKETPQERLKRIMAAQLNKQQQKDSVTAAQKRIQVAIPPLQPPSGAPAGARHAQDNRSFLPVCGC